MTKKTKGGPEIFVAVYRPHKGKDKDLAALVKKHAPTLRRLGFITDRSEVVMRASDGSFIEIAEWVGPYEEIEPPSHPEVAEIWEAMAKIADFPGLKELPELKEQFPHFTPVAF